MLFLPTELWLDIFELIPIKDMCSISLVCKYFYQLNKNELLVFFKEIKIF